MSEEALSLETKQRPWWLTLIGGILAVLVGAVLLLGGFTEKLKVYELLVLILGVYWLVDGVFILVSMFVDHTAWGWKLFMGIISILAGGWILVYPVYAGLVLPKIGVWVLGFWGLIQGIILLVMAFKGAGWGAGVLGVIAIILGIVLLLNWSEPGWGLAMVWVGAITALVGGVALIVKAFQQRAD